MLEPTLATNPYAAYRYALHQKRAPFPAAEPGFARIAVLADGYAWHVLKARFLAGEPAIMKLDSMWADYCEHFMDGGPPQNPVLKAVKSIAVRQLILEMEEQSAYGTEVQTSKA